MRNSSDYQNAVVCDAKAQLNGAVQGNPSEIVQNLVNLRSRIEDAHGKMNDLEGVLYSVLAPDDPHEMCKELKGGYKSQLASDIDENVDAVIRLSSRIESLLKRICL